MLVELFRKASNFIKSMFKEENLAAAQIAQLFGSELLKVQQSARTDGGSTPEIVKMDPKQFLVGQVQHTAARRAEEQRIVQALQREAEAAYPIAEQYASPPEPLETLSQPLPPAGGGSTFNSGPVVQMVRPIVGNVADNSIILKQIASSLERIAIAIERVEIKPKKKTVKQNRTKINKTKLLNEITA